MYKKRLGRLLTGGAALAAAGLLYGIFVRCTGWSIPCFFHTLTGLWCPGCGVTRMCLALLRLDFSGAWRANCGVMAALPALAVGLVSWAWRYARWGETRPRPWQTNLCWGLAAALVLYGVARNIPALSFLAPG